MKIYNYFILKIYNFIHFKRRFSIVIYCGKMFVGLRPYFYPKKENHNMTKRTLTFKEWSITWLKLVKNSVKGNTFAASYINPVEKHLIPYFGDKQLSDFKQCDIQMYLNIIAEKYSLDTLKKHKSCLTQIFETAIDNDFCLKSPVRNIKLPKTKSRIEKSVYTTEQVELVIKYAYMHRFGSEIIFMLETGVSRGELLALRWMDIDLNRRAVYIRHGAAIVPNDSGKQVTVIGEPKNEFRKRDIPISIELCRVLSELPRYSDFVFCNVYGENNNPRTWSRRHFAVFMEDMHDYYTAKGIDIPVVNPHQLRHTRASIDVNSGKNIHAVAKLLGHADLDMLHKRYVHSEVEDLRNQLQIS